MVSWESQPYVGPWPFRTIETVSVSSISRSGSRSRAEAALETKQSSPTQPERSHPMPPLYTPPRGKLEGSMAIPADVVERVRDRLAEPRPTPAATEDRL